MVEHRGATLDDTYGALRHRTRRELLEALRHGPATVSDLARPFDISLAAVSKHLDVLEAAGLVSRTSEGRTRVVTLEPARLEVARAWLDTYRRFWDARLDALHAHLLDRSDP